MEESGFRPVEMEVSRQSFNGMGADLAMILGGLKHLFPEILMQTQVKFRTLLSTATLAASVLAFSTTFAQQPAAPPVPPAPQEAPVVLPRSVPADGKPQINGPRICSSNMGHLFLFQIPATGNAPLTFSADNLPAGLSVDPATGTITGSVKVPVTVAATIHVRNAV